jgi:antitoxin component HigA of HigAB toxin-antitoxin module
MPGKERFRTYLSAILGRSIFHSGKLQIEDYEKEHAQLDTPKVTAREALQHLLDAHDMSAADLARLLDVHRTLGAMILRGERQLTLAHLRTLAKRFSVSADLFLA